MMSNQRSRADRRFASSDEGKPVLTPNGEVVGAVDRVQRGRAYVMPAAGLFDGRGPIIRPTWEPSEPLRLEPERVATIDDEVVVLKPTARAGRS